MEVMDELSNKNGNSEKINKLNISKKPLLSILLFLIINYFLIVVPNKPSYMLQWIKSKEYSSYHRL